MMINQPDRERLPEHVTREVDETLRLRAAQQPDVWSAPALPGQRTHSMSAVWFALLIGMLTSALLVGTTWYVSHMGPPEPRPAIVVTPSVTPFPSWRPR